MRLAYFTKQCAQNGTAVLNAFLTGCQQLGIELAENSFDADCAVIWSMVWSGRMRLNHAVYHHYRNQNKPVFVLEVGMLHRDRTWKLGVNGTTGHAVWPDVFDHERHLKLALIARPWRRTGSEILVTGQRCDSGQWGSVNPESWYQWVFDQLQTHSDRPIVFRPHPRFRCQMPGAATVQVPHRINQTYDSYDFENGMRRAWAVINFNSGPGSQAVLHGVPAFVDSSSLAAPVSAVDFSTIESPLRPDREQWLRQIAHTEWTISELAAGIPLKQLLDRDIFHASSA